MKISLLSRLVLGFSVVAAGSQQAQGPRSFEVASIRPGAHADAEMIPVRMEAARGRIHYVNASLRDCIRVAYGLRDFQINGPDSIRSRFNIDATYPAGATEDQVPEMLQSLLQERFKLEVHRESREHPVYALVVAKNGPKLKETKYKVSDYPDSPSRRPGTPVFGDIQIMGSPSGMRLSGPAVTLRALSETLSIFTNKPVVDQTALPGRYDIDLSFLPEARLRMHGGPEQVSEASSEPRGTVFEAVQEVGLRLDPRRASLPTLVIDSIQTSPTEN